MSGFALFGKNFVNIWPILAGSFLYARFRREPLGTYIHIGLLTTALSPLVSYIALDNGWGNVYSAVAVGGAHRLYHATPGPAIPIASKTA